MLFDGRQITGEPTAVERYYAAFASDAVNLLRDNGWLFEGRSSRLSLMNLLDQLRLGQIVARKAGRA